MLDQYAPRFAAIPGPDVFYLGVGTAAETPAPRRLLPLPHPAYLPSGVAARFVVPSNDPDQVWHRLYAEAYLPPGTALTIWARAAGIRFGDLIAQATHAVQQATSTLDEITASGNETAIAAAKAALATAQSNLALAKTVSAADEPALIEADQTALMAILLAAPAELMHVGPVEAASLVASGSQLSATLAAALTVAPFHRQPALVAVPQSSELPFHPGLAALADMPGGLYEVLLQRTAGDNRRLTGAYFDLVVVASGDGRHSPCLRAVRIYSPRFCYQEQYLPALFHQTSVSDEADLAATPSPPDFRERLLANLEGMLTPIENRVAAAEYLLDPNAAPASTLPWLFSYFGRTLDPSWPEARSRRALATMGRQFRAHGTYRGVCLALDVATDGAVARGEIVLLETFRLRRPYATVLGIPMGDRNVLTGDDVPSGNSIVGDTLTLSAERAIDILTLLAPSAASSADPATVSQFLDEYADRVQVTVILQGPSAALQPVVSAVLQSELPAHLGVDFAFTDQRFILGLSPLLDVDTFLDPPPVLGPLTLDQSILGRDALVRNPAALRQ
jgi:phage tail-like protein